MSTVADLIQITKNRYLLAGASEQRNKLSADYTAGQDTLTFAYELRGIAQGSLLSVGLNVFYVWSVDTSAQTAVVSGGQNGSTDADADSGDVVWASSRHSDFAIFTALNEEVRALSAPGVGLYRVSTETFTYDASRDSFDLPGVDALTSIIEVRYQSPDGRAYTPKLAPHQYKLERNNDPADFSSTFSLTLFEGGVPGYDVTVLYRAPFAAYTSLTQDATDSGLDEGALDIPPMGAALRLLVGREIRRNDTQTQGDTRRAEEVQAGASASSVRNLAALRATRIQEESTRFAAAYQMTL